ncbi:MAG TPA: hypothetical protein VM261_09840 [Kofleriaceae bacterium]|nr:hypothetical protein [Kofleriaceae bacterium]
MRSARALAAVALALAIAACGDDEGGGGNTDAPNPDGTLTDAMDVDAPPAATLTTFVVDLVTNQTAGNTNPRAYADFETLPDPDSTNPAAYNSLFP